MENTSPAYAIQSLEVEALQKSNRTGAMIVQTLYNQSGLKVTEIADKIERTKQQVSASLIRLDELGVVVRRRVGREVFVSLTPLGRVVAQNIKVDVETKVKQFHQAANAAVNWTRPKKDYDKIFGQPEKEPITQLPNFYLDMAAD
jgi:DNA-binding MarR family transcriptional regulator